MKQLTPKIRTLVQHLMEHATSDVGISPKPDRSTFPIVEKLRPLLVPLMGNGGYTALLTRALVLATSEAPWLSAAQVAADGTLNVPTDRPERLDDEKMLKGEEAVLVRLLGLLVAFIGEALTIRLVADVWPGVQVDEWKFHKGDQRDKTQ